MAQKDKVKELVGRGLDSYHTKSLQQIDRIEKKNKEQNHKISILSNELDNDYLTKTEEGSVVSLEHSKEGMVYLDELQGNTLVNYCTDGSKELTLNGDIDVEGTFVTTTEGVDNGKVDVICEGNTLVNLVKDGKAEKSFAYDGNSTNVIYSLIKKGVLNQQYTLICKLTNPNSIKLQISIDEGWTVCGSTNLNGFLKINILPTTINEPKNGKLMMYIMGEQNGLKISDCMLLEGDWTNREIPSYFEGMKSVGQDNENGHKIEILSQNKNYIDLTKKIDTSNGAKMVIEDDVVTLTSIGSHVWCYNGIKLNHLKPNTKYICKGIVEGGNPQSTFRVHDFNGAISTTFKNSLVFTTPSDVSGLCLLFYISTTSPCEKGETAVFKNIQLEKSENSTDYIKRQSNKKEILLNEPLRSIENINKDRIVKIGNKWFIERNLAQKTLDGTENWVKWAYETPLTQLDTHLHCTIRITNIKYHSKECANLVTDRFKSTSNRSDLGEHIYHDGWNDTICIKILQSKLETPDASGFKKWLQNNPIELIYELVTPIYESLEIEPTLNTYNDTTHISNNSIIPCTMKIKNSGYNAIIKPSTLYTVALDTNKSGTIGMNLGGVKGITTNNVATITTPATLTDDSLRLYGKGIKGSKVRLLEGDKTNWIPSHFEGMKSCFEDKAQSDGTYKMEILSNNNNLFNFADFMDKLNSNNDIDLCKESNTSLRVKSKNSKDWTSFYDGIFKFEPNTFYTFIMDEVTKIQDGALETSSWYGRLGMISFYNGLTKNSLIGEVHSDKRVLKFKTDRTGLVRILFRCNVGSMDSTKNGNEFILNNIRILKQEDLDISNKYNKIQFSSIEPLRSVGDAKDRFVFKDDGKLMIERNCNTTILDGIKNICSYMTSQNGLTTKYGQITFANGGKIMADLLGFRSSWTSDVEGIETNGIAIGLRIKNMKLDLTKSNPMNEYLKQNPIKITYSLEEPTYEEIPFELQKIILEGYENGTLFFDTNIPPTSTVTYAGETPIVKATKLNKTEVLSNTNDINDNIVPYLMDMDYRVVCLQLQSENINDGVSMARLFGGTYEMLQRDIQSKRYSIDEYRYRLDAYLSANKITNEEYEKLGDMLNE